MAPKGMGLVQFRAQKETILKLIYLGYNKKSIYNNLKEYFDISYCQFTRIWEKELGQELDGKRGLSFNRR